MLFKWFIVLSLGLIIKLIVFLLILLLYFVFFSNVLIEVGYWLFKIFNFCFINDWFLLVKDIKFVMVFIVINVLK